jgi:V8-like Glu-specific endopeptidase
MFRPNLQGSSMALALLSPFFAACGTHSEEEASRRAVQGLEESQCGATLDFQDVELYNGTLGVSQAFVNGRQARVGHISFGCTGTLVARDLYLSAGHCGYVAGDQIQFNYQVNGSNPPNLRPIDTRTVIEVLEQEDTANADYALIRLGGSPGDTYGFTPILASDPPINALVTIIQHPALKPKKIHAGPVFDYNAPLGWFRYQVDTEPGSSGSGVLNTDGFVIGVHTDGGCRTTSPIEGNEAMRMTSLVAHSLRVKQLANGDIPLVGDFDSDGRRDDLGVWRPSTGTWHAKRSNNTVIFDPIQSGAQGDVPLVGDFDSDGQMDDLGIWRPLTGRWYATRSDNTAILGVHGVQWGTQGDIPLVGDFDSDGHIDDLGIWRPSLGRWYAKRTNGTVIFDGVQWGTQGDIPLVGDFDSDGIFDDLGVWRPSSGTWWATRGGAASGATIFQDLQFGTMGDVPLVGDYDSDGLMDDIGVWRPSFGKWYAKRPSDGTVLINEFQWGRVGDFPLVGDFDSDGMVDDLGVWRPESGNWHAKRSNNSIIFDPIQWGAAR